MTSGIASAASVTPATTSRLSHACWYGLMLPNSDGPRRVSRGAGAASVLTRRILRRRAGTCCHPNGTKTLRAHLIHRRDRQTGDGVGDRKQEHAEREEHARGAIRRDPPPRQCLLQRDETGDDCHPEDVHDSQREERSHERPAATDAPRAVLDAHPERARVAVSP